MVVAALAAALGLTACSVPGEQSGPQQVVQGDKPVKIGFSQATQQSPFYVALTETAT